VLNEYERRQLEILEQQLTGRPARRRPAKGERDEHERRRWHHRSAVALAVLGVVLVVTGQLPGLQLLTLGGVVLLFASLVRWHWADVRQSWCPRPADGDHDSR
jgi:Flp pilus assembly protein TadB